MTFEQFCRYFKVGNKISISGGPAWEVAIISQEEKVVIVKRWRNCTTGNHLDYYIWTKIDLDILAIHMRKVDK